MTKLIKVENDFQVIGLYPNVKQALKAIEVFSGCSLSDNVKPHSVNRFIDSYGFDYVKNCFGVEFRLSLN